MIYVMVAIVNAAAIAGAVCLVLHGHPWMAIAVLGFGCMVVKSGDTAE